MVKHCKVDKVPDSDSFAQSVRTRSPRRPPRAEPYHRSPSNRYAFDVREAQWPIRDERDRPLTCGDLIRGTRRSRNYYIRDSDSYGSREIRDMPDYVGRDRARGSTEQPREPRTYTKRPRSPDRQKRER